MPSTESIPYYHLLALTLVPPPLIVFPILKLSNETIYRQTDSESINIFERKLIALYRRTSASFSQTFEHCCDQLLALMGQTNELNLHILISDDHAKSHRFRAKLVEVC